MRKGRVVVVGDRYTVNAFGLIGIEGFVADSFEKARSILTDLSKSPDVGVILITRDVADMVQDLVVRISSTQRWPVIATIPSRWSGVKPIDVGDLLKRALGVG